MILFSNITETIFYGGLKMNKPKCPDCGEEGQVMGWNMSAFGIQARSTIFLCENPDCDRETYEIEGDYTGDYTEEYTEKEEVKS